MKDKCEWKDGILHFCEDLENMILIGTVKPNKPPFHLETRPPVSFDNCPWCGADIRKPEPVERKAGVFIVNGERFEFEYDIKAGDLAKMITEKTNIECTVEIIEPELAEPLIVKSGGSSEKPGYVAYADGVNYLWTGNGIPEIARTISQIIHSNIWKSFTGLNPDIIELTDEIAKLRPMVAVCDNKEDHKDNKRQRYDKLVYIDCMEYAYMIAGGRYRYCRLVTAHELQDS